MLGAVEGGGTKFLCAVGDAPDRVAETVRIDTTTPDETLARVVGFFEGRALEAVGVGMFGPLDLDAGSTLETPKPGWTGVPVRARLAGALGVPVAIDTDVNAAALAEQRWGAARDADPAVYVTVGTGVGGGVVVGGRPLHGLMHPELGHVPLAPVDGDDFAGACPFHGRCLEGLIAGPSLAARIGSDPRALGDDDPLWTLCARYLGRALASVVLILSPRRVVVGGGVGARLPLDAVRRELGRALGGYLPKAELSPDGLGGYVVPPALEAPGLAGAFALAQAASHGG